MCRLKGFTCDDVGPTIGIQFRVDFIWNRGSVQWFFFERRVGTIPPLISVPFNNRFQRYNPSPEIITAGLNTQCISSSAPALRPYLRQPHIQAVVKVHLASKGTSLV